MTVERDDEYDDYEEEVDELEEAMQNCHQFESGGVIVCMAIGSEDCEFCPLRGDVGKICGETV